MTEEKKKEQSPKVGSFANFKQQNSKNNVGSLKPKRPQFMQKPMKKVTGRGR